MKRILIGVGVLVLAVVLLLGGIVAVTFLGRTAISDGLEVEGIRIVSDGIVGVAVVPVGANQVALIDAGNDAEGKAVLAELTRRQLGPDAVVAIFLTHGHPDHLAAVKLFPKAQVMALEREVGRVEGREGSGGPLLRMMPASPTGITLSRPLSDGEVVTVGDADVKVFAVPGHTPGSAAYLVRGVLFMGDSADVGSDGRLEGSPWIFSDSQSDNIASLLRLDARLHQEGDVVKAIVPAHSGVATDGLALLDAFAQEHRTD